MASINLAALLTPIPGELPCGQDLRRDRSARGPYFQMRDLRGDARADEKSAETPQPDIRPVDPAPKWRELATLATATLLTSAKDLEVAAWLVEAEVRARGLVAMAEGARLIQGLVERFWDELYPSPDEDGIPTRVAPLAGLNGQASDGTLVAPLMRMPVFRRADGTSLALWEWQLSAAGRRPDAAAYEILLQEAALPSGRRQFTALREQADAACIAWAAASAVLETAAGRDRPPMTRIRDILLSVQAIATAQAGPMDDHIQETAPAPALPASVSPPPQTPPAGATMTREDALRLLGEVATFFRRTEPHSPLSYTLEEAARRARMNLLDLLAEIVPDVEQREGMLLRLGVRPPTLPEDK